MTLGGILVLLLLLVSLILFIYFIVVTAKGWGVLHTILLCTLFIECWVFLIFSAGVQYRRVRYTEQAAKNKEAAEAALAETQRLLWGDFDTNSVNLNAVVPVKGELRRSTADRGRVWRGAAFLQANGTGYELELSAGDAGIDPLAEPAADADAPSSDSLPVDLVVYAFAEELNEDQRPIPTFYLGEYTVTQSQAGLVTLEPTLALQQEQLDAISNQVADSWTLYELLPLDSHVAYAAPGSQPSDEAIFGRMDDETINQLFGRVPEGKNRRQKLISSYLRDGQPASDDDPVESRWIQVNILKNYQVDVDSQEVANATERGYFDQIGRSVDARLKRAGEGEDGSVQLSPDMRKRIVLKEEAALPLIENGTAELVQRFFVRPLVDYEEAFNKLIVRLHETKETIALVQRESAELDKANQLGQEMISFRQVENQKLSADLQSYRQEIDVLNVAVNEATDELTNLKTELSRLYRTIQARHHQITGQGS